MFLLVRGRRAAGGGCGLGGERLPVKPLCSLGSSAVASPGALLEGCQPLTCLLVGREFGWYKRLNTYKCFFWTLLFSAVFRERSGSYASSPSCLNRRVTPSRSLVLFLISFYLWLFVGGQFSHLCLFFRSCRYSKVSNLINNLYDRD